MMDLRGERILPFDKLAETVGDYMDTLHIKSRTDGFINLSLNEMTYCFQFS
jgi:hypothetical protein